MSRTYRRTGKENSHLAEWALHDYNRLLPAKNIDPKSERGKINLAKFHSDRARFWMNYRGPSWFHRMFSQSPYRNRARRALAKWMLDQDQEVILESKPRRQYWL